MLRAARESARGDRSQVSCCGDRQRDCITGDACGLAPHHRELQELTISAGLISQDDGEALKALLKKGGAITVALNWTDLLPKAKKARRHLRGSTGRAYAGVRCRCGGSSVHLQLGGGSSTRRRCLRRLGCSCCGLQRLGRALTLFALARRQVEWEFWTNSNDECGRVCDTQRKFIRSFKAAGKLLQMKASGASRRAGRARGRPAWRSGGRIRC